MIDRDLQEALAGDHTSCHVLIGAQCAPKVLVSRAGAEQDKNPSLSDQLAPFKIAEFRKRMLRSSLRNRLSSEQLTDLEYANLCIAD